MKMNKVNKTLGYYCSAVHSLEEERDKCPITNTKCKNCSSYHVTGAENERGVMDSFTGEGSFGWIVINKWKFNK